MQPRYTEPYYLDSFRKIFPFAEFDDSETYFLRLQYYIDRDRYSEFATPQNSYPRLDEGIVAHNGLQIFRKSLDVFAGGQRFYLQQERAQDDPRFPGVLTVTQVYGYAPAVTHIRAEEVDWTRPGWIDRSTAKDFVTWTDTLNTSQTVIFNEVANEFSIRLAAAPVGLLPGDLVQLRAGNPGRSGGTWVYSTDIWTEQTPVLRIVGDTVYIAASTVAVRTFNPNTYETADATLSPHLAAGTIANVPQGAITASFNLYRYSPGSPGTWVRYENPLIPGNYCILQKQASAKAPRARSIGATVERTYFSRSVDGMPVQADPFAPQYASGEATDVLDINTQPTVAEYQGMIANGDLIRPRGQKVGQVLGDVWYLDNWKVAAQ